MINPDNRGYGTHLLTPYSLWYHPKTKSYYVVMGLSKCSTNGEEGREVAVYHSLTHQNLCHRKAEEFLDGRFVPLNGLGKAMFHSDRMKVSHADP